MGKTPGRKCVPLDRICWRSLKGTHTNPRKGTTEWAGKKVSDTHHHAFHLNWLPDMQRLREGNLRVAMEIDEQIRTFNHLIEYCEKGFRINNMSVVTVPNWEYNLFNA